MGCQHYFRLDSKHLGTCENCGEQRQFSGYFDTTDVKGNYPPSQLVKEGESVSEKAPDPDSKPYECSICHEFFKTPPAVGSHKLAKHGIGSKKRKLTAEMKAGILEFGPEEYCRRHQITNVQRVARIFAAHKRLTKASDTAELIFTEPVAYVSQASLHFAHVHKDLLPAVLESIEQLAAKGDPDGADIDITAKVTFASAITVEASGGSLKL